MTETKKKGCDPGAFAAIEDILSQVCGDVQNVDLSGICKDGEVVADVPQERNSIISKSPVTQRKDMVVESHGVDQLAHELLVVLNSDMNYICLPPPFMAEFSSLDSEEKQSLLRYARRCKDRTETDGIHNVAYTPTEDEKDEIDDVMLHITEDLPDVKAWSIVMKKDEISFQTGNGNDPTSPKPRAIKGKSVRISQDQNPFKDAEITLLNNAVMIIPVVPLSSSDNKKKKARFEVKESQNVTFPLSTVLAVMDLEICSSRSRCMKRNDIEDNHGKTEKMKSVFKSFHPSKSKKILGSPGKKSLAIKGKKAPIIKDDDRDDDSEIDDESDAPSTDSDSCDEDHDEHKFRIVVADESAFKSGGLISYDIYCESPLQKALWIHALHRVISSIPKRQLLAKNNRRKNDPTPPTNPGWQHKDLGWRHKILRTSIYAAVILGDSKMVHKILVNKKAQSCGSQTSMKGSLSSVLDMPDTEGYTAAHYAVLFDSLACLRVLLDFKANANAKDKKNLSPVDYAAQQCNERALDMLLANGGVENKVDINIQPRKEEDKDMPPAPSSASRLTWDSNTKGGNEDTPMDALLERGDRLVKLDDKTDAVHGQSVMYKSRAEQLKLKASKAMIF